MSSPKKEKTAVDDMRDFLESRGWAARGEDGYFFSHPDFHGNDPIELKRAYHAQLYSENYGDTAEQRAMSELTWHSSSKMYENVFSKLLKKSSGKKIK